MNVLLTHGYVLSDDHHEVRIMKPYPPIGLLYISAWLEKEGIMCDVFDTTFSSLEEMKLYLKLKKPEIIGIYSTLLTKKNVLKIIRYIKENQSLLSSKIIIGGPDSRQFAQNYLQNGADIVIPGEGEIPFTSVVRFFTERKNTGLSEIKGIIFMSGDGTVFRTDDQPPLDPDNLPFPSREKIDHSSYHRRWKESHGYSSMIINSMRGCPFSCNWCSKSVFGNTYRRRDPANVVEEMVQLIDTHNPDHFWFTDDVFTINREWIRKFTMELSARKVNIPYECISRSDCLDDDILKMLKDSGCRKLWIGAESGSQKVIDLMNRKINIEHTIDIIKMAKEKGISTGIFIMLGYPGENRSDILKTGEFLKRALPDEVTTGLAYPIKGTRFYETIEECLIEPYSWERSSEKEIVFKRQYSDRFYYYAVRYLFNLSKSLNTRGKSEWLKYRFKAFLLRVFVLILN